MSSTKVRSDYKRILVAVDFSPHSEAALKQAVWLARRVGATITLVHTLPHLLPRPELSDPGPKMNLLAELLAVSAEGARYRAFEHATRQETESKLRQMVDQVALDLDVKFEIRQGEPFVEIIHTVQQNSHDLVLAGTRGQAAWEQFFVGSTAKRLIRKCPASVWIAKEEHLSPPKVVLAATDFSDVSFKAVKQALWVAQQADAEFHFLHVVDSMDVPEDIISKLPHGSSLRDEINAEAKKRLESFVESVGADNSRIRLHLAWGTPWKDICRTAQHLHADLIVLGTVGRSGIKGLLLGNTAEKVLNSCDCSILTVKPDDFVSPIPSNT